MFGASLEYELAGSSMSHRRGFFATRADLEAGLVAFERAASVRYVLAGLFDDAEPKCFGSVQDLPLGRATTGVMTSEDRYLALPVETEVRVRPAHQRSGGTKFAIDQLLNPDSVVCCFGGVYVEGVMISGEVSTTGASDASLAMFKLLARHLTKGFKRIGSYWVGGEAGQLLDRGWRLTFSVTSPETCDLASGSG